MGKKRANSEGRIRKRKNGRWEGFYTDAYDPATGKQKIKNVLGKTQAEVKEKLKKAIADSQRLDMNRSGTHTVKSWVKMWYEVYAEPRLRENTKDYYLNYINNHIILQLGDIKLDKLTTIQIQKFYNDRQKNGRVQRYQHIQLKNKGLSVRVVHGIHTLLNNCLEQAVAERLILVNPARGCKLPKMEKREMKVLPEEKIRPYLMEADKRGLLAPFYLELTTGLRRGELLALQWDDLDFKTGTLTVNKQVYEVKGQLQVSVPKTRASIRRLVLPPGVVEVLRAYRETVDSRWMFPSPVKEDVPMTPGAVRRRLQIILERAGCKRIRFHDLRHTFATLSLENGMDVKTLSAMLGHVSAATTLDIYTHVTGDMQTEAAAKIDRGLGNEVRAESVQAEQNPTADFQPVLRKTRKPGTGCISQINDHLFEGRYSPTWPDGTKHSKCVYAHTRDECEAKLKALIQRMNAERQALRNQARGVTPPDKLTKTQKKIWTYMKFHTDETNYSVIARGSGVTRHTAAKWYEMMREMLGRAA